VGSMINLNASDGFMLSAYTAGSAGATEGRVVIQEIFGVNQGATRTNRFAASSCLYGGGIAATNDERPNCPVPMHIGETDASIPMTDVQAIRAAQPKAEGYVYAGAGHGFSCDERGSYSKPDPELAQQRTLKFFVKHPG
jgi:carboxymethylenebutenolidase